MYAMVRRGDACVTAWRQQPGQSAPPPCPAGPSRPKAPVPSTTGRGREAPGFGCFRNRGSVGHPAPGMLSSRPLGPEE
eukprot:11214548-Lingulodinium_polyedra.AAC.1